MSIDFVLNAQSRTDVGKGASRRLRRANMVPAVMYGGDKAPSSLTLDHDEVLKALEHEAFYSHILTVNVDQQPEKAVLRDVQRHPSRRAILHMDLQRVSETEEIHMKVPLHFVGEDVAVGVKVGGGVISHNMAEVEIACLAKDLPEFIEADMSQLDIGQSLHLSDLKLPSGVEIPALSHGAEYDLAVATVHKGHGGAEEEEEGEAEAAAGEAGGE